MQTIKLPYKIDENSKNLITKVIRQYNNVVHFTYNRFREGIKQKEVRFLCNKMKNIELLNSWLIQCAVLEGQGLYKRFKDQKIIFGGKTNFYKRLTNKITKETYKSLDEPAIRLFSIAEVHYTKGIPHSCGTEHILDSFESYKDLKWINKKIQKAFKQPILDLDNKFKKFKNK